MWSRPLAHRSYVGFRNHEIGELDMVLGLSSVGSSVHPVAPITHQLHSRMVTKQVVLLLEFEDAIDPIACDSIGIPIPVAESVERPGHRVHLHVALDAVPLFASKYPISSGRISPLNAIAIGLHAG